MYVCISDKKKNPVSQTHVILTWCVECKIYTCAFVNPTRLTCYIHELLKYYSSSWLCTAVDDNFTEII